MLSGAELFLRSKSCLVFSFGFEMFWKYSFDLMGAQTFWETFLTNAGRGGVLDIGSDPTERVVQPR